MEVGYHHCVYVVLQFIRGFGVYSREEQADVEDDPGEEDMDGVNIDNER